VTEEEHAGAGLCTLSLSIIAPVSITTGILASAGVVRRVFSTCQPPTLGKRVSKMRRSGRGMPRRFWCNLQIKDEQERTWMYRSSSQHSFPYLWSACVGSTDSRQINLFFLNLVNELDPGDRDGGMVKALKAKHWPHSLFYTTVVLFNHVV